MGFVKGGGKVGLKVYTYSRPPIATCPGATELCKSICYDLPYSARYPSVKLNRASNLGSSIPPIPNTAQKLRIHIGGDFDTVEYINNWHRELSARPDVQAWAYTRSWAVPKLRRALERLRQLPNLQLFASVDRTTKGDPPAGWRLAKLVNDPPVSVERGSILCPEQTGKRPDCESCGYCFTPREKTRHIIFLQHR